MRILYFYLAAILFPICLMAQRGEPIQARLFESFQAGQAIIKGVGATQGQFNYDLLQGVFMFLSNDGKEMVLANPDTVIEIIINGRRFVHIKGNEFYEQVPVKGENTYYYIQWKSTVESKGKPTAYGGVSQTTSVKTLSSYGTNESAMVALQSGEVFQPMENNSFYLKLGNNYKRIYSPESFTKNFPAHKEEIMQYIKERKINFRSAEDIKVLMEFCDKYMDL